MQAVRFPFYNCLNHKALPHSCWTHLRQSNNIQPCTGSRVRCNLVLEPGPTVFGVYQVQVQRIGRFRVTC